MHCEILTLTALLPILRLLNGLVGWLQFNVPFQHKHSYIRDERSGVDKTKQQNTKKKS